MRDKLRLRNKEAMLYMQEICIISIYQPPHITEEEIQKEYNNKDMEHCKSVSEDVMSSEVTSLEVTSDSIASQTANVLVEVFGFSLYRAREAVAAVADKSNVELAWNWLLDNGEEDQGGPVVPTQM
jgi:hypothetical protein